MPRSSTNPDSLEVDITQQISLVRGHNLKYLPLAFTEHGAIMAATVRNGSLAVEMSIHS